MYKRTVDRKKKKKKHRAYRKSMLLYAMRLWKKMLLYVILISKIIKSMLLAKRITPWPMFS